jgi:hypothetical protein
MKFTKIFFKIAILGGIVMFSSCTSSSPVSQQGMAKYREITGLVTHIPVTADLDVSSQKIQGEFNSTVKLDKKNPNASNFNVEACQAAATVNALERSGADVLICPIYSVSQTEFGNTKTISVKVTGYPGFYKNFRPATSKDKELLEINPSPLSKEGDSMEYIERRK